MLFLYSFIRVALHRLILDLLRVAVLAFLYRPPPWCQRQVSCDLSVSLTAAGNSSSAVP